MKKNIIIVTGGSGFVGCNLIRYLLEKTKHNIISLDDYSSGTIKNHITHRRVKYLKGHTKDIDKILRKHVLKIKLFFILVNFQNSKAFCR